MTRKIEVCESEEWLTLLGPLRDLAREPTYWDEVGTEWTNGVLDRLGLEIANVEAECARVPRSTCHGWNGATFRRKDCGIGTFDDFSDDEWDQAVTIADDVAFEVVQKFLERQHDDE